MASLLSKNARCAGRTVQVTLAAVQDMLCRSHCAGHTGRCAGHTVQVTLAAVQVTLAAKMASYGQVKACR
jgi:hypothetical protein